MYPEKSPFLSLSRFPSLWNREDGNYLWHSGYDVQKPNKCFLKLDNVESATKCYYTLNVQRAGMAPYMPSVMFK